MLAVELPVTRLLLQVGEPSGAEDVLLAEAPAFDIRLALALAARVAIRLDGEPVDWLGLPAADLDALVLHIRRTVFGDVVRSSPACPECGERMELVFQIPPFLAHHAPSVPSYVRPDDEDGWWELPRRALRFRPPSVGDMIDVSAATLSDARRELGRRCLRPHDAPTTARRRAELAMAALAPSLAVPLEAACPECGHELALTFDPLFFCLRELCDQAATVYEDVHILASSYRWHESEILALPRRRRVVYAEMARDDAKAV